MRRRPFSLATVVVGDAGTGNADVVVDVTVPGRLSVPTLLEVVSEVLDDTSAVAAVVPPLVDDCSDDARGEVLVDLPEEALGDLAVDALCDVPAAIAKGIRDDVASEVSGDTERAWSDGGGVVSPLVGDLARTLCREAASRATICSARS